MKCAPSGRTGLLVSRIALGLDPENLRMPGGHNADQLPAHVKHCRNGYIARHRIGPTLDVPSVAEVVSRLHNEYVATCEVPAFYQRKFTQSETA